MSCRCSRNRRRFLVEEILFAIALVTAMIVIARFAWVFPATAFAAPHEQEPACTRPDAGVANDVRDRLHRRPRRASLAAALALPFAPPNGEAFPYRDQILFVSFAVIFITLVGLGLDCPAVVRWLGVKQAGRDEHIAEHESEIAARRGALDAALKSLDAITDDRELSDFQS